MRVWAVMAGLQLTSAMWQQTGYIVQCRRMKVIAHRVRSGALKAIAPMRASHVWPPTRHGLDRVWYSRNVSQSPENQCVHERTTVC